MPKDTSEFLHYDENCLDREWQRQPTLFHKYAGLLADAKNKYAEAKAEFELVEAELSRAIRATPEQYGLTKTTEALIESTVRVQAKYQTRLREMNLAKYDVDIAQAAVDALHHKKAALESAVVLWCRDYHSSPKLREEDDLTAREKQEQLTSRGRFESSKRKLNERRN